MTCNEDKPKFYGPLPGGEPSTWDGSILKVLRQGLIRGNTLHWFSSITFLPTQKAMSVIGPLPTKERVAVFVLPLPFPIAFPKEARANLISQMTVFKVGLMLYFKILVITLC